MGNKRATSTTKMVKLFSIATVNGIWLWSLFIKGVHKDGFHLFSCPKAPLAMLQSTAVAHPAALNQSILRFHHGAQEWYERKSGLS